jgi:hypothetical protein
MADSFLVALGVEIWDGAKEEQSERTHVIAEIELPVGQSD